MTVTITKAEYTELLKDKARLDFLESNICELNSDSHHNDIYYSVAIKDDRGHWNWCDDNLTVRGAIDDAMEEIEYE